MSKRAALALVVMAAIVASCALVQGTAAETICDGISSEVGGCGEQPVFEGTTCEEVAREFGVLLDERVTEILDEPAAVDGLARSVRMKQAATVFSLRARDRLVAVDALDGCGAVEFLAVAETEFSDRVRQDAGGALYDGEPVVTYEEWLADVALSIAVIDGEEEPRERSGSP